MSGFGLFMLIFGGCVFFTGLYAFTGHSIGILTERPAFKNLKKEEWKNIGKRPAFKNLKKEEWKNIGKWTMIVSLFIILVGILGIVFNL